MGPCGAHFFGGGCGLAAPSLGLDSGVAVYSFMAGSAWNCMTCCDLGSNPHVHPGRQSELLGASCHGLYDVLEHRVGPGEPTGFGDGKSLAGTDSRQGFVPSRPFPFLPVTPWSPLIRPSGHPTHTRPVRRGRVLFVGADPDVANVLRGLVQLSRLSSLSGAVLRAVRPRIQVSNIRIRFLAAPARSDGVPVGGTG